MTEPEKNLPAPLRHKSVAERQAERQKAIIDRRASDIEAVIAVGEDVSKKIDELSQRRRTAYRTMLFGVSLFIIGLLTLWTAEPVKGISVPKQGNAKEPTPAEAVPTPLDFSAFDTKEAKTADSPAKPATELTPASAEGSKQKQVSGYDALFVLIFLVGGAVTVVVQFIAARDTERQLYIEVEILREVITSASALLDNLQQTERAAVRVLSFRMRLRRLSMMSETATKII